MSEYSDLKNMIDILDVAISREENEERFFNRSCKASTHEVACKIFGEIAEEYASHRKSLESKRQVLIEALEDLKRSRSKT